VFLSDQPRDFVRFVGYNLLSEKGLEGKIAQGHLRCHAFLGARGCKPRQIVSGTVGRRLGQQGLQVVKSIDNVADRGPVSAHGW
jgi:hypothetical protein